MRAFVASASPLTRGMTQYVSVPGFCAFIHAGYLLRGFGINKMGKARVGERHRIQQVNHLPLWANTRP
ncbi:hypothetical protein KCP76_26170 (plasmid) [Salmonella enterica subsp. enterica serovar Weltevreden]|nr:hypothetical protein KCP76_26170 [Salmonella enterica subsp. enterica serovar Weltevreden]